ncbi:MAG: Fe2+-dependent dioxygenase [Xanthomonadales bacterium]|nr:Fe2+-dependent dioxygenase [Xanthomonadales bacterium]
MLLPIPDVLSADDLTRCRSVLADAPWADGRITAGHQSAQVKRNLQLPQDCEAAQQLGALVLDRLSAHPLFITAALPNRVFPPLFNCYRGGMDFGSHIDNAIRGDDRRLRTDLSCTLFLNEPDEYDGGELLIEDYHSTQSVKLPAGSLVLYPATTLHRVNPVVRGERLAAFFWVQSMVRSLEQRRLLLDLDLAIQGLRRQQGESAELVRLSGVYHNLLRQWAEV